MELLAHAVNDFLDQRVGIIHSVQEDKSVDNLSLFFHYNAYMCNTNAFCKQKNFRVTTGVALSRERALAKAVGEGIERYCAAIYDKEHLPFCAYEEKKFPCIDPNEFLKYHPDLYKSNHFPWTEFTISEKVRWAPATEITSSNATYYVPAAYIYLPYIYGDSEKKITQNISTGLACHSSYELSAITAICEVVERDAFMIFWRNKLSPPKINIATLPNYIQVIVQEYAAINQEVVLFDITTDIKLPTVLVALRCTIPGNPGFVISAACKLSPELAILSALEEVELTRSYCHSLLSDPESINGYRSHDTVKNQKDHMKFWLNPENLYLANFLFESTNQIDIKEMPHVTSLTSVVQIFSKLGLKVLLADVTTDDIKDYGLYVIRAIIPKLHPLAFGYNNSEFICERLHTVPPQLGFNMLYDSFKMNNVPHPFP